MRSWLKPDTTRKMSISDAAWLAGIVDGEGTLLPYNGGRNGKYLSWKLTVPNTYRGMLVKCVKITGVGSIKRKPKNKPHYKQPWQWVVNSQRNVYSIAIQIYPYLTAKTEDTKRFLKWFQSKRLSGSGEA